MWKAFFFFCNLIMLVKTPLRLKRLAILKLNSLHTLKISDNYVNFFALSESLAYPFIAPNITKNCHWDSDRQKLDILIMQKKILIQAPHPAPYSHYLSA